MGNPINDSPKDKKTLSPLTRSYEETLKKLFILKRFGVKLDLAAPKKALERLGNPHLSYPTIHFGGTNGKGSTAAMVAEILTQEGLKVGLFTSPHLNRFTERIRIDHQEIKEEDVVQLFEKISRLDPDLTFFERTALMAFNHFADEKVDIAVIEVGLGGRLDVTNLIQPVATGILQIAKDHTAYLGHEITRIAWEKAGIMKPGVPVVMAPGNDPQASKTLRHMAQVRGAPPLFWSQDFHLQSENSSLTGPWAYTGPQGPLHIPKMALRGKHQLQNAAVALAITGLLPPPFQISKKSRIEGLSTVSWPGRGELLESSSGKRVLIDAGHNPAGTQALRALLDDLPYKRLHLIVGSMGDKDIEATLAPLVKGAESVITTQASYYRACGAEELKRRVQPLAPRCSFYTITPTKAALKQALSLSQKGDLIVVSGSVFLLGEIRSVLSQERSDPFQVTDPVYQPPRPRSEMGSEKRY